MTYLVRTHIHQVSKTSTPKKGPSPKKKRKSNHDGDASELSVIPSSQSDERELVVPKTSQKDLQEVQASVLAWQELSQQEEQIEFEPGWGNMDMDSMYTATLMFAVTGEALKAMAMSCRTGITMAEPIGAAMAQKATMVVMSHFVLRA